MTTTMQVETWPIDRLIPYDKNPRLNDDAVEAVARSIEEFGFRQPGPRRNSPPSSASTRSAA